MIVLKRPHKIKEELDRTVIGQDEAKITLSVALYNHLKRIIYPSFFKKRGVELAKSNVLLLGPSGSGKTELIRQLAKSIELPYIILDAANLTEDGCKGGNFSDFVKELLIQNKCNIELVERAIVFIDEFDKKTKTLFGPEYNNKSGISDQQALLKLIEGKEVQVSLDSDFISNCHCGLDPYENITVSTKNMLFVFGGAFVGIEKMIAKRTGQQREAEPVVFGLKAEPKEEEREYNQLMEKLLPEDLLEYGVIPELLGRIPVIVALRALELEDYLRIMKEPHNSILAQYKAMFELNNISLEISEEALLEIAKKAKEDIIGARALQGIFSKVMLDNSYRAFALLKGKQGIMLINKACISEGAPALIEEV